MTIPVTLTVAATGPVFDNLPGQVSFSMLTGGANPAAQTMEVRNVGSGALDATAAVSP